MQATDRGHRPVHDPPPGEIWTRWTVAMASGELLGFAVPALSGALAFALELPELLSLGLLVVAGAGEGAVLGTAQWLVLRRYLPALPGQRWVALTAGAAAVAWVLGLLPANINSEDQHPVALLIGGVALGLFWLLLMGGAQWLVMRRHVPCAGWWIAANAVAWPLGVAVPVVALGFVPDGASALAMAAAGVVSGMLMGVVVGGITGVVLVWLLLQCSLHAGTISPRV